MTTIEKFRAIDQRLLEGMCSIICRCDICKPLHEARIFSDELQQKLVEREESCQEFREENCRLVEENINQADEIAQHDAWRDEAAYPLIYKLRALVAEAAITLERLGLRSHSLYERIAAVGVGQPPLAAPKAEGEQQ